MRLKDSFYFSILVLTNTVLMPTIGALRSKEEYDDSSGRSYSTGDESNLLLVLALFGVAMALVMCFLCLCFFKCNGIQRIPVVTASQSPESAGEGIGAPLIREGIWATTLPLAFNDEGCSIEEDSGHSTQVPIAVKVPDSVRASRGC